MKLFGLHKERQDEAASELKNKVTMERGRERYPLPHPPASLRSLKRERAGDPLNRRWRRGREGTRGGLREGDGGGEGREGKITGGRGFRVEAKMR